MSETAVEKQSTIDDFIVLSKLGSGAFSEVFRVRRKSDDQEYALKKVKLLKLSDKEKESALNEVRILASIEHSKIIGYKEAFLEEASSTLCIVMEFADGGDLYSKIEKLKKEKQFVPEIDIWRIFYDMLTGLSTLHKLKIVHRDIKCANIFLTKEGRAKLGDLNVSKIAKQGILQTQTGTPFYASPEVWQDKPYDKRSDIWSMGCVIYELAALSPPFTAKDMQGLYQRVLKGVYPKIPSIYSVELGAMIKCMLQVDPNNRPTCKQIMSIPAFLKKCSVFLNEELGIVQDDNEEENSETLNMMLGTIRIPKNLRLLSERLPKSNYGRKQLDSKTFDLNDSNTKSQTISLENTEEQQNIKLIDRDNNLHSIIEEEPHQIIESDQKSNSINQMKEQHTIENKENQIIIEAYQVKPSVVVLDQDTTKDIETKQVNVGLQKVRSERLINRRINKQGLLLNQLSEKSKEIALKNKAQSVEKVSARNDPDIELMRPLIVPNEVMNNAQELKLLPVAQSQNISIHNSNIQPIHGIDKNSEQYRRIKEYRKKINLNQIPKTSPSSRNEIQDVNYEISQGKVPLYQRHHRLHNIRSINQQSQQIINNSVQEYQQNSITQVYDTPQNKEVRRKISPRKLNQIYSQKEKSPKKIEINDKIKAYQRPARIYSSSKKQIQSDSASKEQSINNSVNNTPQQNQPQSQRKQRIKLPQNLPEIYTGRNMNVPLTQQNTPKQSYLMRRERPSLQPTQNQSQLITPSNQKYIQSNQSELNYNAIPGPLMPRTRSRDAINIQNNLHNYKQMTGANRIVQGGRIDSQRLLYDNYRKLEGKPQSQMSYLPVTSSRPQINSRVFIPMSQQGKRNLALDIVPELPSGRNHQIPLKGPVYNYPNIPGIQQQDRPQWWG
eukprot:403346048